MDDAAAFREAIATEPHERTPKLVYADWLGEHGRADMERLFRAWEPELRLSEEVFREPDLDDLVALVRGTTSLRVERCVFFLSAEQWGRVLEAGGGLRHIERVAFMGNGRDDDTPPLEIPTPGFSFNSPADIEDGNRLVDWVRQGFQLINPEYRSNVTAPVDDVVIGAVEWSQTD